MDLRIIYAIILTLMPITELRVGLPMAMIYAVENKISVGLIFGLIVLLNILMIFFIFFFLDHLHKVFMKIKIYRKIFEKYFEKFQKKVDKFEKKYDTLGFIALVLFVAVPLPGTGAWTGCLVSWLVGLNRKKSILAIALGIFIAGSFIFMGTLGVMNLLS